MRGNPIHAQLRALLSGVLLAACSGGVPEAGLTPAGESPGTLEAAMCAGSSVSTLNIAGISSYLGEMAGSGSWSVVYPANAVRLEYFVDGALNSIDERPGTSGTWYFSTQDITCGSHDFTVRAFPMVLDSAGTRTTCVSTSRSLSQSVLDDCPPLYWSSAGPISGKHCTQLIESADPHTWSDNYLCADVNYGFLWSSAGPISGMRCTQFQEPSDPHTWMDNYLCVPHDSRLQLSWSSAGPISGKRCTQIIEPTDPHTWNDNYLCYSGTKGRADWYALYSLGRGPPRTFQSRIRPGTGQNLNRSKCQWFRGFERHGPRAVGARAFKN